MLWILVYKISQMINVLINHRPSLFMQSLFNMNDVPLKLQQQKYATSTEARLETGSCTVEYKLLAICTQQSVQQRCIKYFSFCEPEKGSKISANSRDFWQKEP